MAARSPAEIHQRWAESYNGEDLASLVALYEPEARLVPQPGQEPVVGTAAIRAVLESFLARKGQLRIEVETESAIQAEDLALLRSHWRLAGPGADGQPVEVAHHSTEVARRQPDGTWRYLIDNPFGAD